MSDLDSDSPAVATSALDRLEALDRSAAPPPAAPGVAAHHVAVSAPRLTRRGRLRKWDRPAPPRDWRWYVGNLGKTLIATGLLMFGFVAYQLWGTGIETARAQNKLENEFEQLLAEATPVTAPVIESGPTVEPDIDSTPVVEPAAPAPDAADPGAEQPDTEPAPDTESAGQPVTEPVETAPPVPVEAQNIPELDNGDALARIEIPAIGVSDIVVAGVATRDLKKGPGHFPDTPLPGQLGNSAIAGHRTTYGQPFHNVDKLVVGDDIVVTTLSGTFTYRVTGTRIVSPSDYQVVATTDPTRATLTLTSCHPKWTARQRIVIFSELVAESSAPIGEPVLNYGRPEPQTPVADPELPSGADGGEVPDIADPATDVAPGGGEVSGNLVDPTPQTESAIDILGTDAVNNEIADAFSEGWFSDPGANIHVGLWGFVLGAISIAAYLLSRRLRRDWAGALVGIMPFVVALYFFFQNVNRLLPPNL